MTGRHLAIGLSALFLSGMAEARTAVWIDTDPAIGPPWREVDDAFALILAFHSPELEIVGLSTIYGNAGVRRTTAVARDLVRRFGEPARLTTSDVHPGARGSRDRTTRTDATEALARALRKQRLTYLALGPLTNLAAFLERHPDLASRIDRIIMVGGRSPETRFALGPNKTFRVHDANVFKDMAAAEAVLHCARPLMLVPIEIAPQLPLRPNDLRALRRVGTAGEYLARRTRVWSWFWTNHVREEGGLLFDVPAVLAVVQPDLIETETRFAQFDQNGDLVASRTRKRGTRPAQFVIGIRAPARNFLLVRLGKR